MYSLILSLKYNILYLKLDPSKNIIMDKYEKSKLCVKNEDPIENSDITFKICQKIDLKR